jgi:DNA-binding PadR family transcriptional regulator
LRLKGDDEEKDGLSILRQRVLTSVRKLRSIDLNMLQIEIIDRLMDGRRTATELVVEIHEIERSQKEYEARYVAIRRELKDLERRGYVSTEMLGRDKPYRLTRHGIAVLSSILPEAERPRILYRSETALLAATVVAGAALLFLGKSGEIVAYAAFAVFFALVGASASAFVRILRRVY